MTKNTTSGPEEFRAKAMARREDGLSPLTWAEVDRVLEKELCVPHGVFLQHTGMNDLRYKQAKNITPEEDIKLGGVPLWVETVLMLYVIAPHLRIHERRLPLPFMEWGIEPRPGGREGISILTWAEVDRVLSSLFKVPLGVFLQHTGMSRRRYQRAKKLTDTTDFKYGTVSLWIEAVLMLYEIAPKFRRRYDPLPLPFEEWGITDIDGRTTNRV